MKLGTTWKNWSDSRSGYFPQKQAPPVLGGFHSMVEYFEENNNFLHLQNQDHDTCIMQARHVSLYRKKVTQLLITHFSPASRYFLVYIFTLALCSHMDSTGIMLWSVPQELFIITLYYPESLFV